MKKNLVLRKLAQRGYKVTDGDLERYIEVGWCPDHYEGEFPDDTVEELIASFELQHLLDTFVPKNFGENKKKEN